MTKRQIIILSVVFFLFVFIIYRLSTGTEGGSKGDVKESDAKKYVKVQQIKNDTTNLYVNGFGRVSSSQNITLSSEVQGLLLNTGFNLKAGQTFTQGQVLFKINDREAQLALKARKSGFLNIVATILPDIKLDFPESATLWTGFLDKIDLNNSLPDLPEFKSNKEKTFLASKNVLAEYYNIKGDEERLKKYTVYAPFNGSVIDVTAEEGTNVNPGTPIATIIKTIALEVAIPVDPVSAAIINKGNEVILFSENKQMKWNGRVSRIAQSINPNTQSIDIYVSIENDKEQSLYNGMYVEADIYGGKIINADEIPRRSFMNDGQVYTVKDSLLIRKKPEVVNQNKNSVVIKGLEDGEQVVIEPIPGAVDSMKVTPIIINNR